MNTTNNNILFIRGAKQSTLLNIFIGSVFEKIHCHVWHHNYHHHHHHHELARQLGAGHRDGSL